MPKRHLYIVSYDITDPKRLRRIHKVVKTYATGGQKSAFECFLTASERSELISKSRSIIEETEDRLALIPVETRAQSILCGVALPATDPDYYYVG